MVKFDVDHQEAQDDHEADLPEGVVDDVGDEDEEEDGSVWPAPLESEADDGNEGTNHPKVVLVLCFHDNHAFKVEEEEQQFLDEEVVFPHD